MNIVRLIVAMPFAAVLAGVAASELDFSAHGPGYLILAAMLWLTFYWLFGFKSWLLADGNPEKKDTDQQ